MSMSGIISGGGDAIFFNINQTQKSSSLFTRLTGRF